MHHYTYKITNNYNQMFYIGSRSSHVIPTLDIGVKYFTSSKCKEFRSDFKLNPNNYTCEVLNEFPSREDAIADEIKLHEEYDVVTNAMSYNLSKQTATGWSTLGFEMPIGAREKISKALKGLPKSKEARENMSKARLANPLHEDAIESIRQSQIGRIKSEEEINKIKAANVGKVMSEEARKKISIANKGKVLSQETKDKISAAKKGPNHPKYGKTLDTEHKKKISNSMKGENNHFYGKHLTKEHKEKIRQSRLGTKTSEETKEKMRASKAVNKITGVDHYLAKLINIYQHKTNELIAENVCAKEWGLANNYDPSALRKTAKSDLTKVHHWKDNPHHTKGVYARYVNNEV